MMVETLLHRVSGVTKIAVLRANALGDYIFSIPALESLRAAYPDAEIVLLANAWHADFITGRPGPLDRVEVLPPLAGFGGPATATVAKRSGPIAAFFAAMRAEGFDIALQLHGGGRHSNPVVSALGARGTAGLPDHDAPALHRNLPYQYLAPEVFRQLEVVGLVGAVPATFTPALSLTAADERAAAGYLSAVGDQPLVALHPGASDPRRRWDSKRFAEVADALAGDGASIVLTGIESERDVVDAVRDHMRNQPITAVGTLPIGGLAALYARCSLVVSHDTGPLHLALAVGASTVGLYWAVNLINSGPVQRRRHRPAVSWRLCCPRCGIDATRSLPPARGGPSCSHSDSFLDDIDVSEVTHHATQLLATPPVEAAPLRRFEQQPIG